MQHDENHVLIVYSSCFCKNTNTSFALIKIMIMEYELKDSNIDALRAEDLYNYSEKAPSNLFAKFFTWCNKQEGNRFLWLGIVLFGQIGAILPITIWAILYLADNNLFLWIAALTVSVPSLILNLGAAETKYTLPVFFFALLTNTVIVLYCVTLFLIH
jgi:hypothetical protein